MPRRSSLMTAPPRSRVEHVDVATAAISEHAVGQQPGQLGRGYDYNPENTFGRPFWLGDDGLRSVFKGATQRFSPDERRWVHYCLGFANRGSDVKEGEHLEERGLEIATILANEARDVQWVAGWLRDGWDHVPATAKARITRQRTERALGRLKTLGLLFKLGRRTLIR